LVKNTGNAQKKKKNKNKNGKSEDIGKTKIKQSKTTQWNMGAFCRELLELRKDQCLGKRTNRRENATTTALQLVLPFGTLERCTNRIVKLYSLSFFFLPCPQHLFHTQIVLRLHWKQLCV